MKLTLQMRLVPSAEQRSLLLATMERFNAAASFAARTGFDAGVFSQPAIHKRCYYELREHFGLSAQAAVRAIGKAVETFRRDRKRCPVFAPYGAVTYDERLLGFKGLARVSLWTLEGRQLMPMIYGAYQGARFDRLKGQVDLVYRSGEFYLHAMIELPEDAPIEVEGWLGVDLGIVNLATDSDGESFSGADVEQKRAWYAGRRALLQSVGSKSARRRLRKLSGKQARFQKDINHGISKRLVHKAKDTARGLVLEDLKGIRKRATVRKAERSRHHNWAFAQLRSFVTYKAKLTGVPLVLVDPAYTSQSCSACGHCDKRNRKSQAEFVCQSCGYHANADVNAAINIAAKGRVSRPMVSEKHALSCVC